MGMLKLSKFLNDRMYKTTENPLSFFYTHTGDNMKVKVIDEGHESDLEKSINAFLSELEGEVVDIKFSVSTSIFGEEQIYCFSALIMYK